MNSLLAILADPNVAFVLFVIGALGISLEAVHPNLVTGVLGGFALILAFIGFGSLPLNLAGVLLVAFGFVLFVLETQFTSHGLLTVAGIAAVALGASSFYAEAVPPEPPVAVAPFVILVTTGSVAVLMLAVAWAAVRTRRMRGPARGPGEAVPAGTPGVVQAPLEPLGTVHLAGETWSARTSSGLPLPRETPVRLVAFDGLVAVVEPADPPHVAAPPAPTTTTPPTPPAPLPADRP